MSKLISIGEALIDFIPQEKGIALKDVNTFQRVAGGAPANVCACVSQLGEEAIMLTQLGEDAFGDYIIDTLNNVNVNTTYIKRTKEAHTGLAFVSLKEDGNRDFLFYRNPSADMLLNENDIPKNIFEKGDILHFCSVDLVDAPVRKAHDKAISIAQEKECIISFDPNVRLALWENHTEYKSVINRYIDQADILKISDEELEFITGETDLKKAMNILFRGNVKVIIYTKGPDGADVYTRNTKHNHKGFKVSVVDTTGAGDSFIGAFIYNILKDKVSIKDLEQRDFDEYIEFANAVGAIVASKPGAISSMPTQNEVVEFIDNRKK